MYEYQLSPEEIIDVLEVDEYGEDGYLVHVIVASGREYWIPSIYCDPGQMRGMMTDEII